MTTLLDVRQLETSFASDFGDKTVLDDINFQVNRGEILGIVGESGSGKSVTALSIMGLLSSNGRVTSGEVYFEGQNLLTLSEAELDKIRGNRLTMIFQDAMTSLDPVFTVGNQLMESIIVHERVSRREARRRALRLLDEVGLPDPESLMSAYPHTLSGGMRQRVMIAIALACDPHLLIADEPTTALDVTIQAQIMALIRRLRRDVGMGVILITHDIGLIAEMADRVLVMYAGQIVEEADVLTLFDHPSHPYTRALMQAVPSIADDPERRLRAIPGRVPELYHSMHGCRFRGRCAFALPSCAEPQPLVPLTVAGEATSLVRCHRAVAGELPHHCPETAAAAPVACDDACCSFDCQRPREDKEVQA